MASYIDEPQIPAAININDVDSPLSPAQDQEFVSEFPMLPPISETSSGDDNHETVRQIKLGEAFKMDHLGPIIINTDGTTRRIGNWDNLSKQEQESSWRLIGARNKKRLEILKKEQEERRQEEAKEEMTQDDPVAAVEQP